MDQAPARERPVTLNVPDHPVINRPDREAADAVDTVDADVEGARRRGRAEPAPRQTGQHHPDPQRAPPPAHHRLLPSAASTPKR